jgi:hypothetical protein
MTHIEIGTGINTLYYHDTIHNLILNEYIKCTQLLKYARLDYQAADPFLVETYANTILGEKKHIHLIYPYHDMIAEDNNYDSTDPATHYNYSFYDVKKYNNNVKKFVESFKILECISDIGGSEYFNMDLIIEPLVIKFDKTQYSYTRCHIVINIDHTTGVCEDDTLTKFMSVLKSDIDLKTCDWLIYNISLRNHKYKWYHANILIVNMIKRDDIKMYYFEPHGFDKNRIGYIVCFDNLKNVVTEYNTQKNSSQITLQPETFDINNNWQTDEPFCASWCLFFMSIVLLNPDLHMTTIYELFRIEQPEIRYLLLFKFLFWFCNSSENIHKYALNLDMARMSNVFITEQLIKSNMFNEERSMRKNDTIAEETIFEKGKKYYFCKKFTIKENKYANGEYCIFKNIFLYQDNLTSVELFNCIFDHTGLTNLKCLANLKKLTIMKCQLPDKRIKLVIPEGVVKLIAHYNKFCLTRLLFYLPKTLEYIQTDAIPGKLIDQILSHNDKIIIDAKNNKQSVNYCDDAWATYRTPYINDRYIHKPKGEENNWCPNCPGNNGINFNNEIEEMRCVLCKAPLENEESKIKY